MSLSRYLCALCGSNFGPQGQSDRQRVATNCSELSVQQKFAIAFTAENRGFDHVGPGASQCQQGVTNFFDRSLLHHRVAYDAALPYLLAAGFELRFDQNDDLPPATLRQAQEKRLRSPRAEPESPR